MQGIQLHETVFPGGLERLWTRTGAHGTGQTWKDAPENHPCLINNKSEIFRCLNLLLRLDL